MEANFTDNNSKLSAQPRSTENLSRGRQFEAFAQSYCIQLGYEVLEKNYRIGRLEADILAADGDVLVLVEVRGRVGRQFPPSRTLSKAKIGRLMALGRMLQRKWKRRLRIELFEILAEQIEAKYQIRRFVICGPASS